MNDASPDLAAVTQVQQQIWSKGDFAMVANIVYNASESLAEALDLIPGERVLDVACGTGIVARLAAGRMGSGGVVGLDINPGMLAVARSLPPGPGPAIEWHEGSVLDMPFPEGSFDICLCQLGLQFFPDRAAALREMRRVLRTGGRLALSVFSALKDTQRNCAG